MARKESDRTRFAHGCRYLRTASYDTHNGGVSYSTHIEQVEAQLGLVPQAASGSTCHLITGVGAAEAYGPVFDTKDGSAKLRGRTPLSLDRDRILYSDSFRRQDDKYHVLFFGKTRRARNYTSHAVKAAHLARTVAGRLRLNTDLAEAIILGSKTGAVPFLHMGKEVVSGWVETKLNAIRPEDSTGGVNSPPVRKRRRPTSQVSQLDIGVTAPIPEPLDEPGWLKRLQVNSPLTKQRSERYFPIARGPKDAKPYSSGAESYWTLAINPFLLERRSPNADTAFTAETIYGIWRHSLPAEDENLAGFEHSVRLQDDTTYSLKESHVTYEAMVARYCDDIAWVIENISEAARVDSADGSTTAYQRLGKQASSSGVELARAVLDALLLNDPGKLYTFFIDDLVVNSEPLLREAPVVRSEEAVRSAICLSASGSETLRAMVEFLEQDVFKNQAIGYRNQAVSAITTTALDILNSEDKVALMPRIEKLGMVEGWMNPDVRSDVVQLLADDAFRLHACVATLVSMSDRDVFDLVGMD
jgi:hypothetical protein